MLTPLPISYSQEGIGQGTKIYLEQKNQDSKTINATQEIRNHEPTHKQLVRYAESISATKVYKLKFSNHTLTLK